MKRLYKKLITYLLLGATLLGALGCSGGKAEYLNADCFETFTKAISLFDFDAAFEQLTKRSTTPPAQTPEATEEDSAIETIGPAAEADEAEVEPDAYITKEAFIAKYQAIFDGVGVKAVTFEKLSEEHVNTEKKLIRYRAVYETQDFGSIENEYEMALIVEDQSWHVDWTPALIFPTMTWGSTVRVNTVAAKRGDILADDELLAETVTLNAVMAELDKIDAYDEFAAQLASIIPVEPMSVIEALSRATGRTALVAQINELELTPDIHEQLDQLEGAYILENYGTDRYYPRGSLLAHTIGYVGYAAEDELAALNEGRTEADGLYTTHSIVGKSGVERAYETVLRGKDGLSITVRDYKGEFVSTIYRKPVENGADVHLTIDLDLQERAEQVMDLVLWGEDTSGAAIVMDPKSGDIKAMVSYPAYDLNKLAISADTEYYNKISKQANNPLQNRMTLGLYPPGSAFKVFTASAALEMGYVTPDYVFTGKIEDDYWTPTTYGTWVWPPIKRTKIKKRSEPMNMANSLLHSDNIYFANLALMMGEDHFFTYLRGIGMEQSFPFELSVAKSTLKTRYDDPNYWNLRSIAETGYGQGQVTISPMQLAAMYCAFRNDGSMPVPRLAKALYENDGVDYKPVKTFENKVWIEGALNKGTIDKLLPMMKDIMSPELNGTGKRLRARGCTVAGKTGTAEIGSDKSREISWFVGFRTEVPEEDELLVLVVLEIPTDDEYKYIKFDIARELISTEPAYPDQTQAPAPTEDADD